MDSTWSLVETTLPCVPLPPNSDREPIRTERLLMRPLREDDLQAHHELRSQPEAMAGTRRGRPDRDLEESRVSLRDFLSPSDQEMFRFGVFLGSTGELIGEGGITTLRSSVCGWPEFGYKFKKEFWGRGFATEFLRALLEAWWKLPRTKVEVKVAPATIPEGGDATEQICAITNVQNMGSRKVLEKLGFTKFSEWTEPDTQEHRLGQPVTHVGYRLSNKSSI